MGGVVGIFFGGFFVSVGDFFGFGRGVGVKGVGIGRGVFFSYF